MSIRLARRGLIFCGIAVVGLVAAAIGSPAHAGTITDVTPSGATSGGQAVDAGAVFTTGLKATECPSGAAKEPSSTMERQFGTTVDLSSLGRTIERRMARGEASGVSSQARRDED